MKNIFELDIMMEEVRLHLSAINFNYNEKGNKAIRFWIGNINANINKTFRDTFKIDLILELKDYTYDLKKNIKEVLEKKFSSPQIETIFESEDFTKFNDSVDKVVKRIQNTISKEDWELFFNCHENYITQTSDVAYEEDNWINFDVDGYIRRNDPKKTKYKFPNIYYLNENILGTMTFLVSSPLFDIEEKTIKEITTPFTSIFNNYYYSTVELDISTTNRNNKDNYTITEYSVEKYILPEIIFTVDKSLNVSFSEDLSLKYYIKYPTIEFKTFYMGEYRKTILEYKDLEKFSNGTITEKDFPTSYHESKKWLGIIKQHLKTLEDNTNKKYQDLLVVLDLLKKDLTIANLHIMMLNEDLVVTSGYSMITFKDVFINKENKPSYILYEDYRLIDQNDTFQILIDLYVDFYKNLMIERNKIMEDK